MMEHSSDMKPQLGNDHAANSEQPEPDTILVSSMATVEPGNGEMADESAGSGSVQVNGEGSQSASSNKSAAVNSPQSRIKADFEFLWRLRKYLLLLSVLAVSVTYNAGLSPPGGFQMDNGLNNHAGDPFLPVKFFRRYEVFFYCNSTAFAASLVLIILLLSRGVARKHVWLRSMQVTMILDLFSLMGAYAAGSCRALWSSIYIFVLVCAVFSYVGIHILVSIRVVPEWLKEWVRKILRLILEKLQRMLNQMLSICPASHVDEQTNGRDVKKEIAEARKFILMLATFAATITYQAGMSPPGGFWGVNDHGYRPGTFVLRKHNLLRFKIFTCCNATSFVASLVTVILLLSTELSTHGIKTGALFLCVVVDLLGLMGAYAAGCSRHVETSLAVVIIIVVALLFVLVLVMFLQSETATGWIDKEIKPAYKKFLNMLSWRRDSLKQNSKIAVNQSQDQSEQAATETLFSSSTNAITAEKVPTYNTEVQSVGSQQVAISMEPSSSSDSGKSMQGIVPLQGSLDQNAAPGDLRIDTDDPSMEKSSEIQCILDNSHRDSVKQHAQPVSSDSIAAQGGGEVALQIESTNNVQDTQHQEKNQNDGPPEKSRYYLLLLAILAVSLTYQAGLNPPGGFWTSKATDYSAGDPILEDSYHKRYLAFFYFNATAFAASLVMIIMLLSRKMSNKVIKRRALQTAMITDLLALTGAFVVGSCREKTKTIYIPVAISVVVAYVYLHIFVSRHIIPGRWKECFANTIEHLLPKSPRTNNESGEANVKDLERRRNLLLILAILAATVTYQAGLNPPGGIWPGENSKDGIPGNPVLQDSHPKRYDVFYYWNAVSFVSSVAIIILLVNRESCEHGIKSYALRVCLIAGLLGLLIAYSAGSCRKSKSVIYLIVIAVAVLICLAVQVLVFSSTQDALEGSLSWLRTWLQKILHLETDSEKCSDEENKESSAPASAHHIDKNESRGQKYLMLLAILAASIAYQAGLNPPGGFWPDDTSDGYKAGNPVLKDINSSRYMVFFVSNSISFMSSIAVVLLLLSKSVRTKKVPLQALHFIMILDLLALVTAYAAGSCRKLRTSIFVLVVVCCVVVYLLIVIIFSSGIAKWLKKMEGKWLPCLGSPSHVTATDTQPPVQDV